MSNIIKFPRKSGRNQEDIEALQTQIQMILLDREMKRFQMKQHKVFDTLAACLLGFLLGIIFTIVMNSFI